MSVSEQASYTLINVSNDSEPPTELQLKQDLGEFVNNYVSIFHFLE